MTDIFSELEHLHGALSEIEVSKWTSTSIFPINVYGPQHLV